MEGELKLGQINMDYCFLPNEDMQPSGVYVNGLLGEMEELALRLNRLVDAELQHAKGTIVEKIIAKVDERAIEQVNICNFQKYYVTGATREYNTIYNDLATQPITITYRIRETVETASMILAP